MKQTEKNRLVYRALEIGILVLERAGEINNSELDFQSNGSIILVTGSDELIEINVGNTTTALFTKADLEEL